jgi:hypothetical protein
MGRWDVQVIGLDDERNRVRIVDAVAKRLGAEPAQVDRLVMHAPTTLVADLEEAAAKTLVTDLRSLGLRVKPRPTEAGGATRPPSMRPPAARPPSMPPPSAAPRASFAEVSARTTGPTVSLAAADTSESDAFAAALHATPAASGRSPLENLSDRAIGAASGLELEDIARPSARPAPPPSQHPSLRPASIPPPAASAPVTRTPVADPEVDAAPREFWSALPSAFLVPLRGPVIGGLFLAPLFMGAAVLCTILGTITALVGMLLMSSAFVGLTMQIANRCLWATAVGERMPAPLPSGFMSEYAFPGLGVVLVQGMIGGLVTWVALQARMHGVPEAAIDVGFGAFILYNVIGFALCAANRSAMGFLDVARIVQIMIRAPFEVLAIALIGGLVQGLVLVIVVAQAAAAMLLGGMGAALLAAMGVTCVVAFFLAYGSALSATMMGMLFWARPEVAN